MLSLRERLQDVPQRGRVAWMGVRPARDEAMVEVATAELVAGRGVVGDRAIKGRPGGKRQITLLQAEHLPVVSAIMGFPIVAGAMRRNLAVAGINVLSLVKLRFAIGECILVGTGPCAPCGKLDELLGPGGFQAARGHGGITAQIEVGGTIRLGDVVSVVG